MIQVKQACEIYMEKFPEQRIVGVLDVGDAYVIQTEAANGELIYSSPVEISKETGTLKTFFPPTNRDRVKRAISISLDELS